jgi:SPP1 gp7 family putative phage head morphogenesis protein
MKGSTLKYWLVLVCSLAAMYGSLVVARHLRPPADAGAGPPFTSASDFFRARGFTIAGISNADLLGAVKTELVQALDAGTTLRDFQKALPGLFDRYGVTAVEPHRIETIYRTNVQSAYGAARYRELTDPAVQAGFPDWRYVAVLDRYTRPSHRALHGKIWRADDPIWRVIYPPWDFN